MKRLTILAWVCCLFIPAVWSVAREPVPVFVQSTDGKIPRVAPEDIPAPEGMPAGTPRKISERGATYVQNMLKNKPFGTDGFDLKNLRIGMGTRILPKDKDVQITQIKPEGHGVPCEWVVTPGADPDVRLLYIHGGGFVSGNPGRYLPLATHLSRAAKCVVLMPDYRLAPEHPFPAGLDDCVKAHEWMRTHSPTGESVAKATFVAGDSAGGNLTLTTILALRDRKMKLPTGGIPISSTTDLTLESESIKGVYDPVLTWTTMPVFREMYLGKQDPRNPLASPVFGDYHGIPPLLIVAGEHEMLRDDSVRVAKKARAEGVKVKLEIWPGMFHVFQSREPLLPEAVESIDHMAKFMRDCMRASAK